MRRARHRHGSLRVRAGSRAPVRERVQEVLRAVHGAEAQGSAGLRDQASALGPGEG